MDTRLRVELRADDRAQAEHAAAAVLRVVRRIDDVTNAHRPTSELSRINLEAPRAAVPVSDELFRLLRRAQSFSRLTGGTFDITAATVARLYDLSAGVLPDHAQLAAHRPAMGWSHLELDDIGQTVRFAHAATRIDLGGFARGYALDLAVSWLQRLGIAHARVTVGGDCRVVGDRGGRSWSHAVRYPGGPPDASVATLRLEDASVATSHDPIARNAGDTRRQLPVLDPVTGRPARGTRSVTVVAPDGLTAQALRKHIAVCGPRQGLVLIERMPGVDALVIDADGRIHRSHGLTSGPTSTSPGTLPVG